MKSYTTERAKVLLRLLNVALFCSVTSLFLIGATCPKTSQGGGGGNDQLAAFYLRLHVNGLESAALKDYQIQVTWQAELLEGGGTTGDASPFTLQKPYSGKTDTEGGYTVGLEVVGGKRPGKWLFTVSTDLESWSSQCEENLQGGQVLNVNFTHGKPGCTIGLNFP